MSPPAVAIVLPTYEGEPYLERLYESVRRLRYPADRRHLIVVENASDLGSARWFARHAPEVGVVVPGYNAGYAGGAAIGMQKALGSGVPYVAVLTQDTVLDPDWLGELVEVAERHPRAGAVQPKILREDEGGHPVINTWGNELHYLGVGFCGGDGLPDRPLDVRPLAYPSGAGLLCRSSVLEAVGVFDPDFFMYHEDTDLGWRMRLAGYEVLLAPRAVMHHLYEFRRNPGKFYYIERNRLTNLVTHYRWRTLFLLAPALLAFEAMLVVHSLLEGSLRERLAAYGFFLRPSTWRYLARKRREVQALRRVPDRAIAAHLTGRIDFPPVDSFALRRLANPALAAYWWVARRLLAW